MPIDLDDPIVPTAALAPAPTVHYVDGQDLTATSLSAASVDGSSLVGALVTVCTASGCETVAMSLIAADAAYAEGTAWSLTMGGDTSSSPWRFDNWIDETITPVISVAINVGTCRSLFDTAVPWSYVSGTNIAEGRCIVQYSNDCEIGGGSGGTHYTGLAIRFEPPLTADTIGRVRFIADTDLLGTGVEFEEDAPPPPPPPPPAVDCRVAAPSPLGALLATVGPTWAYASAPGPLGAPRVQAWDNEFSAAVAALTSLYVMDLDTPSGIVRVPISSWQATLRTGSENYVQCQVPAALQWLDAINEATAFSISRRTLAAGGAIEVEMARAALGTLQVNSGPFRVTATLSGNSTGFAVEPDPLAPATSVLQGVRSTSTSSNGLRVRCAVDWLLRPGQIAELDGVNFPVRFISYFVSTDDAYMDVAELA